MITRIISVVAIASLSLVSFAHAQEHGRANAQEVQPGPGVLSGGGGDDRPGVVHPMPPLDQIPPLPMPVMDALARGPLGNTMIIYDESTGESRTITVRVDPGLTGGAGGGGLPPEIPVGNEGLLPRGFGTMSAISTRNVFPWSANCKVAERFNNGAGGGAWYVCSGTMIDPTTCLVAGHCVYNHGNGIPDGWATDVYVFPGWDGAGNIIPPSGPGTNTSYANFGYAHSRFLGAGTDWVNNSNRDQDWGVVALDRAVGGITGWYGTAWGYDCATIQGRTYYNASYPAENPCGIAGLHNGQTMYFWSGGVDSCPGNQLHLNTTAGCFTAVWGGMSGSSMYYFDGSTRVAHAVCSTSNRTTSGNYCKLDQGAFNYINSTFIPSVRGTTFDLQALNCVVFPTTIQAGSTTATQNFLMYNATNGTANATWTYRVYLSTNDSITTADTLLSTQTISWNFGALSSVRVNMVPVTIPSGTPTGTYWIGVIIDPASDSNSGNNATNNWDAVQITVTPAAPSNDLCPSAIPVSEGAFSGNTSTSNTEGSATCGLFGVSTQSSKDVWYRYTASATGTVNINTCGSAYDTVLSVHGACTGTTGNQLACDDDNAGAGGNNACGGGLQSGLDLAVTAGAVYTIRVAGYNGASGSYILNIVPIPAANDNCAAAIAIAPGTYTGSTGFANTDGAASCGYSLSAPDVWYSITPTTTSLARLDTCTSAYDSVLSVHTDCPGTLDNEIACDDDNYLPFTSCYATLQSMVNVPVQAGSTYYVRVAGYNGHNGAYTLHYNVGLLGDTCDAAIPVSYGATPFDNTGATTDGPTESGCTFCCLDLQINQDLWYSIVPPCGRLITIDTIGSSFDTKLAVYAGCPVGNDTAVVCNDDFAGLQSRVALSPVAGTTYLIRVGAYSTNFGAGVLNVNTCLADYDCSGNLTVADVFAFLNDWFAGNPNTDFDGANGLQVADIFAFLNAWFAGCP